VTLARFVVGIDLGTTNSALAYVDTGVGEEEDVRPTQFFIPQVLQPGSVEDRPLLPSYLYLPGPNELPAGSLRLPWDANRDFAVGEFARQQGGVVPTRVVSSAKSWLCHSGLDRKAPVLQIGADVMPQDVFLETDAAGDLTVAIAGDPADSIAFAADLTSRPWGVVRSIDEIHLGDGTVPGLGIDGPVPGPMTFTSVGSATNMNLVGSGFGANVVLLGPASASGAPDGTDTWSVRARSSSSAEPSGV